jgi:hypothetical protein
MSQIWAWHQDISTDWPSVTMWLWLWLWKYPTFQTKHSYFPYLANCTACKSCKRFTQVSTAFLTSFYQKLKYKEGLSAVLLIVDTNLQPHFVATVLDHISPLTHLRIIFYWRIQSIDSYLQCCIQINHALASTSPFRRNFLHHIRMNSESESPKCSIKPR